MIEGVSCLFDSRARSIEGQMKKQKLEKQDEEADAEGLCIVASALITLTPVISQVYFLKLLVQSNLAGTTKKVATTLGHFTVVVAKGKKCVGITSYLCCSFKMSIELLSTGDVAMTADDVMDSDDADWYRQEVGAEPDPGKLRRRKIQLLHLWTATNQTLPIIFLLQK